MFEFWTQPGLYEALGNGIYRWIFFGLNLITFVFACALMALGHNSLQNSPPSSMPGNGTVAVGVFLFLFSLLGIVNIKIQSKPIYVGYFISTFLFLFFTFVIGLAIADYYNKNNPLFTADAADFAHTSEVAWNATSIFGRNTTQQTLNCCGFRSFKDEFSIGLYCPPTATMGCEAVEFASYQTSLQSQSDSIRGTIMIAYGADIAFSFLLAVFWIVFLCLVKRHLANRPPSSSTTSSDPNDPNNANNQPTATHPHEQLY